MERKPSDIYPEIPKESGDRYRLAKSDEVLNYLESEARHYEGVRKKYSRSFGIIHKIGIGSGSLSIVLTSAAFGTFSTGIGIPIAVPIGALGGIFGIVSVVSPTVTKKLSTKVSKHGKITSIAKAKANTVKDLVSKALIDGKISDQEFALILAESDKYEKLKSEVREKQTKKNLDKNTLLIQAKEEILRDFAKTQR